MQQDNRYNRSCKFDFVSSKSDHSMARSDSFIKDLFVTASASILHTFPVSPTEPISQIFKQLLSAMR